jgi:NADPH-dependent ferric siderophore reductase
MSRIALLVLLTGAILAFFYFDLERYLSLEALKAHRDALMAADCTSDPTIFSIIERCQAKCRLVTCQ